MGRRGCQLRHGGAMPEVLPGSPLWAEPWRAPRPCPLSLSRDAEPRGCRARVPSCAPAPAAGAGRAGGRRASLSNSSAARFLLVLGRCEHTHQPPVCCWGARGFPKHPVSPRMRAEGALHLAGRDMAHLCPQGCGMMPETACPRGLCLFMPQPHPASSEPALWI